MKDFWQRCLVGLFHLLILTSPFIFTWVNEELFEFNKMLLIYAFTGLICTAWINRMATKKQLIFRKTPLDIPLTLFLISQLISTLLSMHPQTSVWGYYTRFHGGLASYVSYSLLYWAFVSNVSAAQVPGFLASLSISGTLAALYAIPEHFGHSPSCFLITEGKAFDVSCWVQDVKTRVFGTFGQPNWLAAFAVTVMPISTALLLLPKRTFLTGFKWTLVFSACSSTLWAALLFTGSRSGFLAGVIALATLALLTITQTLSKKSFTYSKSMTLIAVSTSIVLITAIFGSPFTPSLSSFITSMQKPDSSTQQPSPEAPQPAGPALEVGGTESGVIRAIVWEGAVKVWLRHFWFGSGVETFAYSYYLDRPVSHNTVSEWDFLYNKAHNEFLNFLATTGLVGFATYLGLLGSIIILCFKTLFQKSKQTQSKYSSEVTILASGVIASTVGLSISNFFGFSTVIVTMLLFLLPAVIVVLREAPLSLKTTQPTKNSLDSTDATSVAVIIPVISLLLVWWWIAAIVTTWKADFLYTQGKNYLDQSNLGEGIQLLEQAHALAPNEGVIIDDLSFGYAQAAATLGQSGDATNAAQFAEKSISYSDLAIEKNPVQINFYRTRARVFTYLSLLDPKFLNHALEALNLAQTKAPTDAKIMFNRALMTRELGDLPAALTLINTVLELKPNYDAAKITQTEISSDIAKNATKSGTIRP